MGTLPPSANAARGFRRSTVLLMLLSTLLLMAYPLVPNRDGILTDAMTTLRTTLGKVKYVCLTSGQNADLHW